MEAGPVTQIRPRLSEALAADVQAYADSYSKETGIPVSFNTAVRILIRHGLQSVPRTVKGDGTDDSK